MSEIFLTELRRDDSAILFNWINDRSLVILNNNYDPIHEINHDNWFTNIIQKKDVRIFAIRLVSNEEIIGICQLFNIDFINSNAELQIRIGNSTYQGKGLGREAVKAVLQYSFNDLGLHRVYLKVFSTNVYAIKAYQKLGFNQEGILKEAAFINGRFIDILMMAILNK